MQSQVSRINQPYPHMYIWGEQRNISVTCRDPILQSTIAITCSSTTGVHDTPPVLPYIELEGDVLLVNSFTSTSTERSFKPLRKLDIV